MIIGITGRSGSGKSYLSEIIAKKFDMIHLDIDKISHEVLSFPNTQKFLLNEFGESVFKNGVLNRKILGNIAFNDKQKLQKLNDFCQHQIETKLDQIISSTTKSIILDYALLWKLKQFKICNIKILLETDFEIRYKRVFQRENISRDYFEARDNSLEEFADRDYDYIFKNITDKEIEKLINTIQLKENLWLGKPLL